MYFLYCSALDISRRWGLRLQLCGGNEGGREEFVKILSVPLNGWCPLTHAFPSLGRTRAALANVSSSS